MRLHRSLTTWNNRSWFSFPWNLFWKLQWTLFWLEFRPPFGGFNPQNKGQTGSRYIKKIIKPDSFDQLLGSQTDCIATWGLFSYHARNPDDFQGGSLPLGWFSWFIQGSFLVLVTAGRTGSLWTPISGIVDLVYKCFLLPTQQGVVLYATTLDRRRENSFPCLSSGAIEAEVFGSFTNLRHGPLWWIMTDPSYKAWCLVILSRVTVPINES